MYSSARFKMPLNKGVEATVLPCSGFGLFSMDLLCCSFRVARKGGCCLNGWVSGRACGAAALQRIFAPYHILFLWYFVLPNGLRFP